MGKGPFKHQLKLKPPHFSSFSVEDTDYLVQVQYMANRENLPGCHQALAKSIPGPIFTSLLNHEGFGGGEEENAAAIPCQEWLLLLAVRLVALAPPAQGR